MPIAQKQRKWTVEEFLTWHEGQEERYELVGGIPVLKRSPVPLASEGQSGPTMMTGASRRHNKISGNLLRRVSEQLDSTGCDAFANDAAVRTAPDQIRYPDLVVDCGTRLDDGYIFEHPKLVAEILSPSTRSFDLAGKITEYWRIDTLAYILVVDPEQQRAQLHMRQHGGTPTLHLFAGSDDLIDLPDISVTLRLGDLFAGLPDQSDIS